MGRVLLFWFFFLLEKGVFQPQESSSRSFGAWECPSLLCSACVCVTPVGTAWGQRRIPGAYLHYPLGIGNFSLVV